MTNEQSDAMTDEGIYPDDDADTHSVECDCEDCEPGEAVAP